MKRRSPGLYVIAAALILAIGVPSAAVGFGEGRDAKLGKRNPSSGSLTRETQIIANNGSYGTRQSNKRNGDGGGAIYGCRSNPGNEPCVRANNLKGGRAFEFVTVGKEAGRIEVGGDHTGAPFTTNATGVATGLNADQVDGKSASDFAPATALTFAIVTDSPTATSATVTGPTSPTLTESTVNGDAVYVVDLKRDVSKCAYTASPVGSPGQAPGVAATTNQPNQVTVNMGTTGTPATPNRASFHLQVIC